MKDKNIANEITYALQVTYHVSCYCLSLFQALMLLLDGFFLVTLKFQIISCFYGNMACITS